MASPVPAAYLAAMEPRITPDLLLEAYRMGIFPMARDRHDARIFWMDPERRGILPLAGFRLSRSLARSLRKPGTEARFDTAFEAVLDACAAREETWINDEIRRLYLALHALGHAHSQEVWRGGSLIGGVYGVALGGAFFGESMFSRETDGSKMALAWLVARLRLGGFRLFDTQYLTPHLQSLGAVEVSRNAYRAALREALATPASLARPGAPASAEALVQLLRGAA